VHLTVFIIGPFGGLQLFCRSPSWVKKTDKNVKKRKEKEKNNEGID